MDKIKIRFMWVLAHSLYFLGDITSKPLNWDLGNGPTAVWFNSKIYSIYNWSMIKSSNIDEKYHFGIWTA